MALALILVPQPLGRDMGAAKRMGEENVPENALPKNFGPLQEKKSCWAALSWIFVQEKQSTDTWNGVENVPYEGPKPLFGKGVIREVFHPPLFSPPMASSDFGAPTNSESLGERQSVAQKGVRAIDARNSQLENGANAAKTSVRAPGLSTDEREHPLV